MKTTVAIELDKSRNLRFDVNALVKIEELTGKPVTSLDSNQLGIKDIRSIVYAGLRWEDTKLTMDRTGVVMTEAMAEKGLEYLIDKISDALTLAFGIEDEDEEKN